MEELTSTVAQNTENVREVNTLGMQASAVAKKGGEIVNDVVQTMNSIHESSKKVVNIINVIDEIAFQTNILALNAGVEAAARVNMGEDLRLLLLKCVCWHNVRQLLQKR